MKEWEAKKTHSKVAGWAQPLTIINQSIAGVRLLLSKDAADVKSSQESKFLSSGHLATYPHHFIAHQLGGFFFF